MLDVILIGAGIGFILSVALVLLITSLLVFGFFTTLLFVAVPVALWTLFKAILNRKTKHLEIPDEPL